MGTHIRSQKKSFLLAWFLAHTEALNELLLKDQIGIQHGLLKNYSLPTPFMEGEHSCLNHATQQTSGGSP